MGEKIYFGGNYSDIKSEFIRNKIKGRKWKDRDYIDDLISLERRLIDQPKGQAWVFFEELRKKYKKEFQILLEELKPEWWKYYQLAEKESKKIEKEFDKELEKEEKEDKRNWIKLGGKP